MDAAEKTVLKALAKKKRRKLYRDRFEAEFTGIRSELSGANTVEEVNSCADKAERLRDEKLVFIADLKNRFGIIKTLLVIVGIFFILLVALIIYSLTLPDGTSDEESIAQGETSAVSETKNDEITDTSEAVQDETSSESPITIEQTYISGTPGQTNEGPENLFDTNARTKWCITKFEEAYVIWKTSEPISVNGYIFVTANDNAIQPGRNPLSWTLYACNASSTPDKYYSGWKEIDHVENSQTLEDVNYTEYRFEIEETLAEYEYYMLVIEEIQSGDTMQLSEFTLTCEGSEFTYAKP